MPTPTAQAFRPLILCTATILVGTACAGNPLGDPEEDYPTRPIDWVVPYDPGGASDQQIRRMQEALQENLGEDINIVYQPGGDGATGWQQLSTANPDGYTIGNVVVPNMVLTAGTGYELEDFEYVTFTEAAPNVLAVAEDGPYEDLEGFVEAAEESPGSLSVAGIGERSELALAEIVEATGIDVNYVPVSGGAGPVTTQMQGGHVDAAVYSATHVAVDTELHGLAVSGADGVPGLPDVPTFEELGYSDVQQESLWGVALPPETPEEIVTAVNDAVLEVMEEPDLQEQIEEEGLVPVLQSPEEAESVIEEHEELVEQARELLD